MSNGNNNGHHPNGTGNGLVHSPPRAGHGVNGAARNGNGAHNDPAIIEGNDLLWDGLPPAVTQALGQPLDAALVSQRKGRGGRTFDYLEGHVVIDQANRIFGFGGWGYELAGDVTLRQFETVNHQTGEVKTARVYMAPVRVTVAGALPRTDLGFHAVAEDNPDGHDTASKGAVTDGMKRAFRSFGVQFGNGFYGDQQATTAATQPVRVSAQTRGNSRQSQANGKAVQPRADKREQTLRKRLMELAGEQGFDEAKVRAAVQRQTGKSVDDLTADELGSLIEAAANKLNQMRQAQAA